MAPHADPTTENGSTLKPTAATFQPVGALADERYHSSSSSSAIAIENKYAAHNYHPLPIVFARASGASVWDPEGRHYIDCLSAYSAVNQGHCHPELVKALCEQASRLTLSSRAFHNDVFPKWAEKVQKVFGYDMVLPMNTGAEAVETAIKIARKWAYKVKGVPQGQAIVFAAAENFHGRTVRHPPPVVRDLLTWPLADDCDFHVNRPRVTRQLRSICSQRWCYNSIDPEDDTI